MMVLAAFFMLISNVHASQHEALAPLETLEGTDVMAFVEAAKQNNVDDLHELITKRPAGVNEILNESCGLTPIFYAAFQGNVAALQILIDAGADVNGVEPPLAGANFNPATAILAVISKYPEERVKKWVQCFKILLSHGADFDTVRYPDGSGSPPQTLQERVTAMATVPERVSGVMARVINGYALRRHLQDIIERTKEAREIVQAAQQSPELYRQRWEDLFTRGAFASRERDRLRQSGVEAAQRVFTSDGSPYLHIVGGFMYGCATNLSDVFKSLEYWRTIHKQVLRRRTSGGNA
jgi:hypothetical protein